MLGGSDAVVGGWMLEVFGKVLALWHRYRAGELPREALLKEIRVRQQGLQAPLHWGTEHGYRKTLVLCGLLLD